MPCRLLVALPHLSTPGCLLVQLAANSCSSGTRHCVCIALRGHLSMIFAEAGPSASSQHRGAHLPAPSLQRPWGQRQGAGETYRLVPALCSLPVTEVTIQPTVVGGAASLPWRLQASKHSGSGGDPETSPEQAGSVPWVPGGGAATAEAGGGTSGSLGGTSVEGRDHRFSKPLAPLASGQEERPTWHGLLGLSCHSCSPKTQSRDWAARRRGLRRSRDTPSSGT